MLAATFASMATQEFYIRNEADTEARGPFNFEQLSSLADSGQVTPATLFYDATTEQWTTIESNADLKLAIFPEKRKLTFRAQEPANPLNKDPEGAAPITVNDMLAAAEGRTYDTKDKRSPVEAMARAAAIGRWAAILALLLAAAGELLPWAQNIMAMDAAKLATHPIVLLGALDLLLAIVLGLGVVAVYPFVRFRAALGLGFLGFIFWTHGQAVPLLALVGASVGLFLCTASVRLLPVLLAAVLALGGYAFVSWQLLS